MDGLAPGGEQLDCGAVRGIIERSDLPAEAEAHVASCPSCAALAADRGALARALAVSGPPRSPIPDALLAHLEERLPEGPLDRLRSLSTRGRIVATSLLGAIVLLAMGIAMRRADIAWYPVPRLLAEGALQVAMALTAGWLVLRPLYRAPLSRWVLMAVIAAALATPFVLASLPAAHQAVEVSLGGAGDDWVRRALACFTFGLVWTAPLLVVLRLSDRLPTRGTALASAGAAGSVASVALLLHCPLTHPAHLVAGHATVGLAMAAAVVAIRRR